MKAITHTQDLALPFQPFANATSRVNEWRGRCLDSFTRAEAAVTECLIALAEVEGKGQQVRLPHLVGQRLDALAQAVAAGGPFEAEGTGASLALERFRVHDSFRNMFSGDWREMQDLMLPSDEYEGEIIQIRHGLINEHVFRARSFCPSALISPFGVTCR